MESPYPIIEVLPEWVFASEYRGGKEKFWYQQPGKDIPAQLFKYPRENTGEHWAEKLVAEVAKILEIPCAPAELATFGGIQGAAIENVVPEGYELIPGNEVLEGMIAPAKNVTLNFHMADHTLENIMLVLDRAFETTSEVQKNKLRFTQYLVLDAVVGNTDRHSENWGMLRIKDSAPFYRSLSPSYDHGSSLGCELTDERRGELMAMNRVGDYVERGRGQIFRAISRRRRPSPVQLVVTAIQDFPNLFRRPIEKLSDLNPSSIGLIVDSVPDEYMTQTAKEFSVSFMRYSSGRLQEALNG